MCRVLATEVGPSYAVVGCVPLCCGRQREAAARHAFRPTVLAPPYGLRRGPKGAWICPFAGCAFMGVTAPVWCVFYIGTR